MLFNFFIWENKKMWGQRPKPMCDRAPLCPISKAAPTDFSSGGELLIKLHVTIY